VKVLSLDQIAVRLNDRFRLLTGGSRTAMPRHQTLRAAMDWSYALLTDKERRLLARSSVFAASWTLEAAEAICAGDEIADTEVLDLVAQLVDKSLVTVDDSQGGSRYRLPETVRQYSRDRLLEMRQDDMLRRRHRDWHLRLANDAESGLRGPEQAEWLARLDADHDASDRAQGGPTDPLAAPSRRAALVLPCHSSPWSTSPETDLRSVPGVRTRRACPSTRVPATAQDRGRRSCAPASR